MFKDLRFALRQLLKQWGFTAIAVLTLALAIGATTAVLILLNGKSFTVVGVMPSTFDFPLQLFNLGNGGQFRERAEIWKPLAFSDEQMKARYSRSLGVIGRLAPGTSVAKARAEIETINTQMRREHPNNYGKDNSFGGDAL